MNGPQCTVIHTTLGKLRVPHSQRRALGRNSLIKLGTVSSVDSKPRLYLRETWHCVWAYYWCTVRPRRPCDGTTEPLCSVWTKWAPQKSVCQFVMHASVLGRDKAAGCRPSRCVEWRDQWCGFFVVFWTCREAGKWNAAVLVILQQSFSQHLPDLRMPSLFKVWSYSQRVSFLLSYLSEPVKPVVWHFGAHVRPSWAQKLFTKTMTVPWKTNVFWSQTRHRLPLNTYKYLTKKDQHMKKH